MKDASEWEEDDILSLEKNKIQESLTLDYKKSDALGKQDYKKKELSKDVSAFANSQGGVLLYGMEEDGHYPCGIDEGVDPNDISKEWIEQVINSTVHPKIEGLRINQIHLKSKSNGRVAYAICIPQAIARAPHQASDKRYYKRYNFASVPMEDYEIRDALRRATTPDLWVDFNFDTGRAIQVTLQQDAQESDKIKLFSSIGNRSSEPALYAVISIYIDVKFSVSAHNGFLYSGKGELDGYEFNIYHRNWGVPGQLPIFCESPFSLFEQPFLFSINKEFLSLPEFRIGYSIRSPGFSSTKLIRIFQQKKGILHIMDKLV